MNCPICAQVLEGGELVMVCSHCHKALGGGLSVNATGEFRIPSAAELDAAHEGSTPGAREFSPSSMHTPPGVHNVNVCSWCGKLEAQVKKLLGRNKVALCNECVSLCCDILDAELGQHWR